MKKSRTGIPACLRVSCLLAMTAILIVVSVDSWGGVEQITDSELYLSPFWDFYSENHPSYNACGRGYAGIAGSGDISSVTLNPASLSIGDKYQFCFEYIYKDKVQWLLDDIYLKTLHPNLLVGFGFKPNDSLETGILYFVGNSYRLDCGEIDQHDSLGQTLRAYDDVKIDSFVIPFVINCKNIRYGMSLKYNRYSLKQVLGDQTGKVKFIKIVPEFGVILFPANDLSLGLKYLPETKEAIVEKWSTGTEEQFEPNIFPARIGIGIQYTPEGIPASFFADYNCSDDSRDRRLVDRDDLHLGVEYNLNKNLTLKTGIFTQADYRKNRNWLDEDGDYDQVFTTMGASLKRSGFTMNLSVMDSHLLSSGKIEQTCINSGICYDF